MITGQTGHLSVAVGCYPGPGERTDNFGTLGCSHGPGPQPQLQGIAAALATGATGGRSGRIAADLSVQGLLDAHASLDPLRGVKRNGMAGLAAVGRWLHANRGADSADAGMAASVTALVLRGRQAHVFHVGSNQLYCLREGRIVRLTTDHRTIRALGAADETPVDYFVEPLSPADRYLLCSGPVAAALPDRCIRDLLAREAGAQDAAACVAGAAPPGPNRLVLVIDVIGLPTTGQLDLRDAVKGLPIIPTPRTGVAVDRFQLETMLSDGQYSRVFRATDQTNGRVVIAKFPKDSVSADPGLRDAFLREAWIAAHVSSPFLAEVIEIPDDRRTALYTVMPFYEGQTLEQRLRRAPRVSRIEGLGIARKLARAVAVLHRHGVIHRDIKPDNVVLTADGGLRLLDFGVARLPNLQDTPATDRPGTPSFMAPELFGGAEGDERTDIYAFGVTIYRMFTGGAYPYGEIEPFSRPRFTRPPTRLSILRPDLPGWLDQALQRAVAAQPDERQADVLELLHSFEHAAGGPIQAPGHRSLLDRNPVLFWQVVSVLLAAALILVLALPAGL